MQAKFRPHTMNEFGYSDEQRPVTWFRGYPLYTAHVIVIVYVISMIATAVMMWAPGGDTLLRSLSFSSTHLLRGEVWRAITYGLVNQPSLWFAVDMVIIIWFGRELEKAFGRRRFLAFYGLSYLLTPVVYTIVGLWIPNSMAGQQNGFAFFIAFATLYPGVMFFLNIMAKWLAVILVALYTLIAMSQRDLVSLISLWSATGFAFFYVRFQQGLLVMPTLASRRRESNFHVVPDEAPRKSGPNTPQRRASMAEVDALLDKIAQSGIGSLTAQERAKLDAARDDIRRESRRG